MFKLTGLQSQATDHKTLLLALEARGVEPGEVEYILCATEAGQAVVRLVNQKAEEFLAKLKETGQFEVIILLTSILY